MTVAFQREALTRAVRRLPPFDAYVLVCLALAADPGRRELTGPWDALGDLLGLEPVLLPPILARLCERGGLRGRVDAPDGVHLHFDGVLAPAPAVPPNLPLEPAP